MTSRLVPARVAAKTESAAEDKVGGRGRAREYSKGRRKTCHRGTARGKRTRTERATEEAKDEGGHELSLLKVVLERGGEREKGEVRAGWTT